LASSNSFSAPVEIKYVVWNYCNHVIGPYFFDATLNEERYANFLTDTLPILLDNVPLDVRVRMWYQQDGAPAHRVRYCVNILNQKFPRAWIGLNGPIAWPARSPDLTPLDIFLWQDKEFGLRHSSHHTRGHASKNY